jgi:uncharacterized protein DUF4440
VTGSGKTYTKADLLEEARSGRIVYEHQEDSAQTVRIWGDTAVVTAKLWEKGTENGKPFDYTVWFSDSHGSLRRFVTGFGLTGNSVPCSFPDRSLFRLVSKT